MTKISADTAVRIIVLAAAFINQALTAAGKNPLPFSDGMIYEAASLAVTAAAAIWVAWKNNSVTGAARTADRIKDAIKAGVISAEEAESLLRVK